ncbi:MAG: AI-2E family transporter [Firmicutes bacterium]|nr:AI-2E family transporter [Bacillota bacterium]
MDNDKNTESTDERKFKYGRYAAVGLTVFIVFCCCLLFFFLIYRLDAVLSTIKAVIGALSSIIIGAIIAYLFWPLTKRFERLFGRKIKKKRMARRALSVASTYLVFLIIFSVLLWLVIPALFSSINSFISSAPDEVKRFVTWLENTEIGDTPVIDLIEETLTDGSESLIDWLKSTIIPEVTNYVTLLTSSVMSVVSIIIDFVVGIVVSIYLLMSAERFIGQAKKITYALLPTKAANSIISVGRRAHKIFIGFIGGRLVDSAIIGVISYFVMLMLGFPDTMLLAVIIGITNILPFFGPFIGAVPCFVIVAIQNPIDGLWFLIFILVLQQVDGNIIGPRIVGGSTGLSSFWVIFAILLFGGVWGFAGMLLGVPITALSYALISEALSRRLEKKNLSVKTADYVTLDHIEEDGSVLVYEEAATNEKSGAEDESTQHGTDENDEKMSEEK